MERSVITGTGCYIPTVVLKNSDFGPQPFYGPDHVLLTTPQAEIIRKFQKITGINERRYAAHELNTADIAALAAEKAIADSGIDPETLDQIVVAHNFGNVLAHTNQSDAVPSLANRVKHQLKIKSPNCIGYDILFGCPGWIQGVIQVDAFFKAGIARKALVIGAETLSRVIDAYDRDSMIFSDGAGAAVLEYRQQPSGSGILACSAVSHSEEEVHYINMEQSYGPGKDADIRYLKMKGRKVYEYALKQVPQAMKNCLDKSGINISQLKKIFIHQANEKMDEAIIDALYKLYGLNEHPADIMPMSIHYLGNSSVATVPTLYDLVLKGQDSGHSLAEGDVILFASVGAGMNINAICYRV